MPDLPVCLRSVLVRPLPALYFRDSDPANYISHAPLLAGLQLGSANGRHWLETGGWEEGRSQGISPHLSLSLLGQCLGHSCTSSLAPAPPPRPTVVPAATEWPQLWGTSTPHSHLAPPAREVEAASSCWEIQGYLTSSPGCSFVSNACVANPQSPVLPVELPSMEFIFLWDPD